MVSTTLVDRTGVVTDLSRERIASSYDGNINTRSSAERFQKLFAEFAADDLLRAQSVRPSGKPQQIGNLTAQNGLGINDKAAANAEQVIQQALQEGFTPGEAMDAAQFVRHATVAEESISSVRHDQGRPTPADQIAIAHPDPDATSAEQIGLPAGQPLGLWTGTPLPNLTLPEKEQIFHEQLAHAAAQRERRHSAADAPPIAILDFRRAHVA